MWLVHESSFNYRSLKCKINPSRLTSSLLTLGPGSVHCWSVRVQLGGFYVLLLCLALWALIGLALVNYRFSQEVSNWVLVKDCFFVLNSAWMARRGATIRLKALICLQRPIHFSSVWQQSFLTFTEATGLPLIYVLITGGCFFFFREMPLRLFYGHRTCIVSPLSIYSLWFYKCHEECKISGESI